MAKDEIKLKQKEPFPDKALKKTVQDFPSAQEVGSGIQDVAPLTFMLASSADVVQKWGMGRVAERDRQLREFAQSETTLVSALYSVSARNSAFEWEIETKSDELKDALTLMFNNAIINNLRGWIPFMMAISEDYYGTDNGAFIEIIRDTSGSLKRENAPVIGIAHLDSGRCMRTGNPDTPVIYTDRKTRKHKMPWYSIIPLAEFPSSMETMNGVGFCAVSRVLKHAQIMRNLAIYKDEKISGRFYRAIHFVGGVSRREIEDIVNRGEENADNKGLTRFIMPEIIASLDPEKPVSTATIDLAALPDGFNLDEELRWYINTLALGFGVDYQDFAPLPGGNIGSSAQSEILHRKSRGKGSAVFMQTIENVFLYYGVIPTNTKFSFVEKDMAEEAEKQELRTKHAEEQAILVGRGVYRPRDARTQMIKRGFIEEEDIEGISEEYGEDIVGAGRNEQLIGKRGSTTIGEDAARTKEVSPLGTQMARYFTDFEDTIGRSVKGLLGNRQRDIDLQEEKTRDLFASLEGWIEKSVANQEDELGKVTKQNQEGRKELMTQIKKMGNDISKELGKQKSLDGFTAHRLTELDGQLKEMEGFLSQLNGDEELVIDQRDEDGRIKQALKYRNGEVFETLEIVERDVDGRTKRVKKQRV